MMNVGAGHAFPTGVTDIREPYVEVLALGNLDPHIHFAILGDFVDADARELPGDPPIVAAAREDFDAAIAVRDRRGIAL